LIDGGSVPAQVLDALKAQLLTAREILSGLGYADNAVQLVDAEQVNPATQVAMPTIPPATYAGFNDKRQVMFLALDHLYENSPDAESVIPLSPGAPFGTITIDKQACTLCLSCTSVCPSHAVFAGNEAPKLLFNENRCVQCGICASACPEQAITLQPRLLADAELRQRHVTLHEEEPLCCVSCGKPFATRSVVQNMLAKLENHWMFQDERAKRRLMMCDDCRVVDIVQDPKAMSDNFNDQQRH
jgi:ferredoxin